MIDFLNGCVEEVRRWILVARYPSARDWLLDRRFGLGGKSSIDDGKPGR